MKDRFFVLGGRYKDATFTESKETLERHGPFASREEAYRCWQSLSWRNADDCLVRYEIVSE